MTDSPVAELREAASRLRKLATAATPGPWERPLDTRHKNVVGAAVPEGETGQWQGGVVPAEFGRYPGYANRYAGQRERVAVVSADTLSSGRFYRARSGRDLEYIASMHPLVGAALADLLDAEADSAEQSGVWAPDSVSPGPLAVARAYLLGAGESR